MIPIHHPPLVTFTKASELLLGQYHTMQRCFKSIKCSLNHGPNQAEHRKGMKNVSRSARGFWILLKGQVFESMRDSEAQK